MPYDRLISVSDDDPTPKRTKGGAADGDVLTWVDANDRYEPVTPTGGPGADDQTAAEVPFTPVGTIAATDTQAAVAEVATDAASALSGHAAAGDPHTGYRLESADHSHASTGLQGGTVDHGALTGLSDDDHPQYATNTEFDDHSARHENGGADEISIAGLDGTSVELAAHLADAAGAHAATAIAFTPNGSISATDVQAAIQEVRDEAGAGATVATDTIWDAKGDLAGGTGANTAAKLTAGANDTILMADSAETTGLKWVASATPSTQAFGDAPAIGTDDTFTRGGHKHGMPDNAAVETAYAAVVAAVSQAEAEAGTVTSKRSWTPERVAQAIAALGFAPNVAMQVKTSGTGTYTPTAGMVKVLVICVGGGGGTPAVTAADEASSGGGGGGTAIKLFTAAEIGASQAYAVGATSTTGGNTSGLGTANALLQATGGAVGALSGNLTVAAVKGGLGGIGTLGDLNIRGGPGGPAVILSTAISTGGNGGDSLFGGGGRGGATATTVEAGEAGGVYGGGAGGGKSSDGTDTAAVAGAAGVIYFIEFLKVGAGAAAASELDYAEITSSVNVTGTGTDEAGTQLVVAANAVTFDGSTKALIEFYCASVTLSTTNGAGCNLWLFDGSTQIGLITQGLSPTGVNSGRLSVVGMRRLTPTAGSHTYKVRGQNNGGGTHVVNAGAGGANNFMPAFIRITKV